MAKRRGNKEGSIYRRKDDGRWIGQVSVDGHRMSKSCKTQREAREWLKQTLVQVEDGLTIKGARTTLASYLDSWLETTKPTVRPKTWVQYEQIVRQHVKPTLGAIRLKDLRPDHVQTLYTSQLERGLGPRSVRLIHAVLHRALNQALRWGLVRRNVCEAVDKPKQSRAEMQTFDLEQTQTFLRAVEEDRIEALFYLAISTGLRQGELLGLKWADLDFDSGRFQVQRQLQRIPGEG